MTVVTTYYVRAYATNSAGTAYGNEITFTSSANLPTLSTTTISVLSFATAATGGTISSDGAAAVTARGVCWSTSTNPTSSNDKTVDGTSIGAFTSSISGLTGATSYYLRAYATNNAGTAYGNQINFTTPVEPPSVKDIDGNKYYIATIGSQIWMTENLKTTKNNDGTAIQFVTGNTAWSNLYDLSSAYCWYNNDEATYKNTYGALYNYANVEIAKLCPVGWHVPSNDDWTTLFTFLGGASQLSTRNKLFKVGITTGATNSSGFTATPNGYRDSNGLFKFNYLTDLRWWTSTITYNGVSNNYPELNYIRMYSNYGDNFGPYIYRESPKNYGFAVRCIKN